MYQRQNVNEICYDGPHVSAVYNSEIQGACTVNVKGYLKKAT